MLNLLSHFCHAHATAPCPVHVCTSLRLAPKCPAFPLVVWSMYTHTHTHTHTNTFFCLHGCVHGVNLFMAPPTLESVLGSGHETIL